MRKVLLVLCALFVASSTLYAQNIGRITPVQTASATLSTQNAACVATACTTLSLGGYTKVSVSVFGTCGTCTLQFEASIDGTNWVAVNMTPLNSVTPATSTSAAGVWQGTVGAAQFRARMSALSSGNFAVVLRATL